MQTFWDIFWIIFWIMMFFGISFTFFYLIRILRSVFIVMKTASDVTEQIRAISDLIEDIRTKANMGVFIDVLELSKRLFFALKGNKKKNLENIDDLN